MLGRSPGYRRNQEAPSSHQPVKDLRMRKIVASLGMLAFAAFWIWGISMVAPAAGSWPAALEIAFYVLAGTLWILPLRPLLHWMNANVEPEED
jgi:hypothetical protein